MWSCVCVQSSSGLKKSDEICYKPFMVKWDKARFRCKHEGPEETVNEPLLDYSSSRKSLLPLSFHQNTGRTFTTHLISTKHVMFLSYQNLVNPTSCVTIGQCLIPVVQSAYILITFTSNHLVRRVLWLCYVWYT